MLDLSTLQANVPIVDQGGKPTPQYQQLVQALVEHIRDLEARLLAASIP